MRSHLCRSCSSKASDSFQFETVPDIWYMVDIKLVRIFKQPVTRAMLAEHAVTSHMVVLQKGSRLSIQPVTTADWQAVHELAGIG